MSISGAGFREKTLVKKKRVRAHRCSAASKRYMTHIKFWMGGIGYGMIELLWRGETHWSMVLTGGACLLAICRVNKLLKSKHILIRAGVSALVITAVELAVGLLVNCWWGMNVWDYSGMFGNVLGQICPLYSFLWFLLCIPISAVLKGLK